MGQTDKQALVHSPVPQSYSLSDKRYNERVYAMTNTKYKIQIQKTEVVHNPAA